MSASPREMRERLRAIVTARSLSVGEEVRLASGAASRFYFNMKETMFDPEGASLIADLVLDALAGDAPDYVGGLEMGAVPIVACVSQRSFQIGRPVPGFFVRKEVKDHGTKRRIEGRLEAGRRAVILEDVTTTGGSALQAVEAARGAGVSVEKIVTIVDRLEGAAARLATHDLTLVALLTARDFEIEA